jgi:integral membrane sensor domain MASE1
MSSSPATYILRITNLVLIYALLARLILVISDYYHDQISVFWAPGGFALAALLVWGWKYWPGIFLGAVTASLMVDEPLLYALIQALSKTVGILLSIKLLQQFADFDNRLKNLCSFVLLALAAVCSSLISDFAAGLGFHYLGYLSWENFTPKLIRDWQSDILGIVLITPICLIWRNPPLGWFSREQVVETVVLFISCFLVGQVIFLNWFQSLVGSISLGY